MYSRKPHHVDIAHAILKEKGIPRDQLPYTESFIELWIDFCNKAQLMPADYPSYQEFWKLLCSAAKKGGLAKDKPGATAGCPTAIADG